MIGIGVPAGWLTEAYELIDPGFKIAKASEDVTFERLYLYCTA